MSRRLLRSLAVALAILLPEVAMAAQAVALVVAYPRVCKAGLYPQPLGKFAALLFCDDAAGSTLGVACYSGVSCEKPPWQLAARFWQEERWARDVTAFAWDPDGSCLYVSTSGIYGQGNVFALDLPRQKATVLPVKVSGQLRPKTTYSTELLRTSDTLEYKIEYGDVLTGGRRTEVVAVPLGHCGRK